MKITDLGVGLIGGSVGLAARGRGIEVTGFGRSPERLRRAAEVGAIDVAAKSLEEALTGAEVCFCCAPVGALPEQVAAALAAAGPDCVVTDVGSVKRAVVEASSDERFIGGHPLAGAETAGVEHARADLFEGAVWYLTPGERSGGLLYERLHRLVKSLGAEPVAIDPASHDHMLATISHLPHVVANALVQAAGARDDVPRIGPSFRDATRVAGASSDVWTPIYLANREAIAEEIDALTERLRAAAETLRAGDAGSVTEWNDAAADARRRLLSAGHADGPVHELRLTVPNRPGIVANVALALGKAGVNIVDMSLSPAPDMRSGAMSLYVAGDDQAARATALIEDLGFPVARDPGSQAPPAPGTARA